MNLAVLLALATTASCARPITFQRGNADPATFALDRSQCHALASDELSAADQQAERFDSADSASMIGAGLAAMFAGGQQATKRFNDCMREKGYTR